METNWNECVYPRKRGSWNVFRQQIVQLNSKCAYNMKKRRKKWEEEIGVGEEEQIQNVHLA